MGFGFVTWDLILNRGALGPTQAGCSGRSAPWTNYAAWANKWADEKTHGGRGNLLALWGICMCSVAALAPGPPRAGAGVMVGKVVFVLAAGEGGREGEGGYTDPAINLRV